MKHWIVNDIPNQCAAASMKHWINYHAYTELWDCHGRELVEKRVECKDLWDWLVVKMIWINSKTNRLCGDNDCTLNEIVDKLICSLIKKPS